MLRDIDNLIRQHKSKLEEFKQVTTGGAGSGSSAALNIPPRSTGPNNTGKATTYKAVLLHFVNKRKKPGT